MNNLAPICLFVYNRPDHTKQTIEALQKNNLASESNLYIFSDGAKNEDKTGKVAEVRNYIQIITGFQKIEIIESPTNKGLANSVINGVTKIINEYGKIIVLEDDLITTENFLDYMNNMLSIYKDKKEIFSISGYNHSAKIMEIPKDYKYDIYFNYRPSSWGWATWKNKWGNIDWEIKDFKTFIQDKNKQKQFNRGGEDLTDMLKNQIEGNIDSWAIRWAYHCSKKDLLNIYPIISLINNIGMDGTGVHCGTDNKNKFINELNEKEKEFYLPNEIKVKKELINNFKKIYIKNRITYIIINLTKKIGLYNICSNIYRKIFNLLK